MDTFNKYAASRALLQLEAERVNESDIDALDFPKMGESAEMSDIPLFLKKQAE